MCSGIACTFTAPMTAVTTRGWCWGAFEVLTAPDGEALGSIPVGKSNDWKQWPGRVLIPDGIQSIYLRFKGAGCASLYEFELSKGL